MQLPQAGAYYYYLIKEIKAGKPVDSEYKKKTT